MKKVSIIIPLYNLEKLIGKCIASALAQDLSPEEYEILVIDDGSTDGSLAAAEKAAQVCPEGKELGSPEVSRGIRPSTTV